jgi:hypothetical protein
MATSGGLSGVGRCASDDGNKCVSEGGAGDDLGHQRDFVLSQAYLPDKLTSRPPPCASASNGGAWGLGEAPSNQEVGNVRPPRHGKGFQR